MVPFKKKFYTPKIISVDFFAHKSHFSIFDKILILLNIAWVN